MAGDTEVTIIYERDGSKEVISCYSAHVKEGVLHVRQRMHAAEPDRHIPLERIREYQTREL